MNPARVSSPPRPANEDPAHLWWICIRVLLLFALALLPVAAGGILLLKGLHERATTGQEAPPPVRPSKGDEVAER
jgi:hypothetical protein